MALVTAANLLKWVQGDGETPVSGYDASVVDTCIAAAGDAIVDYTSRVWEKTPITEYFDGDRAAGVRSQILILKRFPVFYAPPGDNITVTENGLALVVGQGYTTTADVIVKNVGLESHARLIRTCGSWACGVQNILVTYPAGFASVPVRISQVAEELAWLMFLEGRKVGLAAATNLNNSRTLISSLSDFSKAILADAKRF